MLNSERTVGEEKLRALCLEYTHFQSTFPVPQTIYVIG